MKVNEGHSALSLEGPAEQCLYDPYALDELADRALALTERGRSVLGVVGEPGAGKSTFCEQLLAAVRLRRPGCAVGVSMDAFHLAQRVLVERDQAAVKGAIETFDASGFASLLQRTRMETDRTVWWPEFRRDLEEPIAGSIAVEPGTTLVVVDGNFLLDADPGWLEVRGLLTESWFLQSDPALRQERLAARYVRYGFSTADAWAKVRGIDEVTSARVRASAGAADLTLVELGGQP
jgi:pantothenate kinase